MPFTQEDRDRLRSIVEMNHSLEFPLSVSIGVACYPDDEKGFCKAFGEGWGQVSVVKGP